MKHLFLPYGLSAIAKEKGFNEPCLAEYFIGNTPKFDYSKLPSFNFCPNLHDDDIEYCTNNLINYVSAPLYQQIVDWFTDKHKITIQDSTSYINEEFVFSVKYSYQDISFYSGNNYYEALNKAIEEAFKLI